MKETAAEKFERIIHIIEAECQNSFHTKKDICELVSKKVSMSERDLNAVFIFLTDKTLREYIKERKLASAYHYLISAEEPSITYAVEISGLGDQSAFSKAFKQKYNITPKEATHNKDESLLDRATCWDDFSVIETESRKKKLDKYEKYCIWGTSKHIYNDIILFERLAAKFKCDEDEKECAYLLSLLYPDIPAEKIMDYLSKNNNEEYIEEFGEEYGISKWDYLLDYIAEVDNPIFRRILFDYDIQDPDLSKVIAEKMEECGYHQIDEITEETFAVFVNAFRNLVNSDYSIEEYSDAALYFFENTKDESEKSFREFIDRVEQGWSYEDALLFLKDQYDLNYDLECYELEECLRNPYPDIYESEEEYEEDKLIDFTGDYDEMEEYLEAMDCEPEIIVNESDEFDSWD